MDVDVLFAGVAIRNLDTSLPWYRRVFGREPDIVVHDNEVMWHVASSGWVYLVCDIERAGRGLVTMAVRDLDAFVAEAADRGAWGDPIESVDDAGRKASYADPDGNRISFIEVAAAPGT